MARLLVALAAALVLVPAASAAYPTPYAAQGGSGLASLDGSVRYIASDATGNTLVSAVRPGGATVRSHTVAGGFGIPVITQGGLAGGLFHDGSAFVLQSLGSHETTRFAIVQTRDLSVLDTITLDGAFGFDALSPDGSTLYLIQHSSADDLEHYVVRAYDLRRHALLPGRIADKTQKSWVMQGFAVARTETPDGRWDYTLYANPGGYPFIHALDTVRGVAHCIGLPWQAANQGPIFNASLALTPRGLAVRLSGGSTWRVVDTKTWRVHR